MAERQARPVAFLATAEALDDEMVERIDRHKAERRPDWRTVEAPTDVAAALATIDADAFVMLDCLSLWVSNLMLAEVSDIEARATNVVALMKTRFGVVVTNEVGMGIVPDNALARRYRDELGRVNALFAHGARERFLVMSGHTLKLETPPA
jgi:adenosylcobinamide kinase / adenosylcobinamide-phosphate guanylyltransferase